MDLNQNTQDYDRDRMMERINEHERVLNGLTLETVRKIPGVSKLVSSTIRVNRGVVERLDGEDVEVEASGGGDGIDWAKVMFGYAINPDGDNYREVRIYAGRIGGVVVDETDYVFPEVSGNFYLWVRRTKSNDAVAIGSGATWPTDSSTYAYYVLYRFTLVAQNLEATPPVVGSLEIMEIIRPLLREKELPAGDVDNPFLAWDNTSNEWVKAAGTALTPSTVDGHVLETYDNAGTKEVRWGFVRMKNI